MNWIKEAAVYVFAAGFFYLILAYIADFSVRQSVVLALLIASLPRGIASAARKPARRFSPYDVSVNPNWYQLLTDFPLIDRPEEWHVIQKSLEEWPPKLRNGIRFTVVHQSEDFQRTLIYLKNTGVFLGKVHVMLPITDVMQPMGDITQPITIEREHDIPMLGKSFVFMKPVQDGYDLGIIVPAWWWDKVKARCPKPMKEDNYYLPGGVALILGTISYREFDLYWEPVEWPGALYDESTKQAVDRRHRRDDQRIRLGWKKVDWPHDKVEHKYFSVEHWRI